MHGFPSVFFVIRWHPLARQRTKLIGNNILSAIRWRSPRLAYLIINRSGARCGGGGRDGDACRRTSIVAPTRLYMGLPNYYYCYYYLFTWRNWSKFIKNDATAVRYPSSASWPDSGAPTVPQLLLLLYSSRSNLVRLDKRIFEDLFSALFVAFNCGP